MRAAVTVEFGGVPEYMECPEPHVGPGDALVEVCAAALNPVDIAISSGAFYRPVPAPPFIPGAEFVGRVVVSPTLTAGMRVWGLSETGAFAQRVAVPDTELVPVPDGISNAMAAAIGIAGLAGWMPVRSRGRLAPGEHVLVLGASGVVGQTAIRAAVLGGAARVVAAARSREGLALARDLGAHDVVSLAGDDVATALSSACPDGVNLVIDPLWGAPLVAALGVCRFGARIVQIGSAAGQIAAIPAGRLRGGQLDVLGFSVFNEPVSTRAASYTQLAAAVASGQLTLETQTVPLGDIAHAWTSQASGVSGGRKFVLVP